MSTYLLPSAIGAITVGGIKFLSDHTTPEIAAVLGAAPIGYLSTLFIETNKKTEEYLANYALFLLFTIVGAMTYMTLLKRAKLHKVASLVIGIVVIMACILVRIFVFK